jgi:type III secretion system low calcium response chaperone LcrH/SycD
MLTAEQQETLYGTAYGLYETGSYGQAADFFTHLLFHCPFETRFWKGLASCRQMEGSYEASLRAWAILCLLSPSDPFPHFHAAECLLSIGDVLEAEKALCSAQKLPGAPQEKIALLQERLCE